MSSFEVLHPHCLGPILFASCELQTQILETLLVHGLCCSSNTKTQLAKRPGVHFPYTGDHVCRRFETGGPSGRRVSAACPSPDGSSAWARHKGGRGARRSESGVGVVGIPRPSCSSRAQVGCACSRGLQASTRVREASGPKGAPVSSSSSRGRPSRRGPWSFLL
jgi:hypothetical protein